MVVKVSKNMSRSSDKRRASEDKREVVGRERENTRRFDESACRDDDRSRRDGNGDGNLSLGGHKRLKVTASDDRTASKIVEMETRSGKKYIASSILERGQHKNLSPSSSFDNRNMTQCNKYTNGDCDRDDGQSNVEDSDDEEESDEDVHDGSDEDEGSKEDEERMGEEEEEEEEDKRLDEKLQKTRSVRVVVPVRTVVSGNHDVSGNTVGAMISSVSSCSAMSEMQENMLISNVIPNVFKATKFFGGAEDIGPDSRLAKLFYERLSIPAPKQTAWGIVSTRIYGRNWMQNDLLLPMR
jgi:hypothetical protein